MEYTLDLSLKLEKVVLSEINLFQLQFNRLFYDSFQVLYDFFIPFWVQHLVNMTAIMDDVDFRFGFVLFPAKSAFESEITTVDRQRKVLSVSICHREVNLDFYSFAATLPWVFE